jgi:hypothetical protein
MTVVPQDRNEITSWLQQPNVPRPIIGAIQDDVLKKRYGIESFITRDLHSFIVLSRMAKLICQDLTPYLRIPPNLQEICHMNFPLITRSRLKFKNKSVSVTVICSLGLTTLEGQNPTKLRIYAK